MNVLHVVPSGLSLALEPGLLLALLIAVPLAAALLAMLLGRAGALVLAPSMLGIALILALLAKALIQAPLAPLEIGGWGAPLGIDLYLDGLALVMLVTTAVIVMAVALAGRAIAASSPQGLFWPLLLIGWAGLNALFLSADLFNLYVAIEVVSLAAIALTGLTRELTALRAALGYLFVSLLGSLFFLMGTALLYRFHGLLDLPLLAEAMTGDLSDSVALALITAGLLFKTALVPLHSWLPLAHASAAPPISALLSAIVVKATFYLLLRIWGSLGPGELPYALLAALGMIAVLWGSLQALRAEKLKAMIAYSTVAQLGYLFIALAMLARAPDLLSAALLFVLAHALAKAAMFLAASVITDAHGGEGRIAWLRAPGAAAWPASVAFALAAISLIGLPPTAGFVAKWQLLTAAIGTGELLIAAVLVLGSLMAAAYLLRPTATLMADAADASPVALVRFNRAKGWTALTLALAAMISGGALAGIERMLPDLGGAGR